MIMEGYPYISQMMDLIKETWRAEVGSPSSRITLLIVGGIVWVVERKCSSAHPGQRVASSPLSETPDPMESINHRSDML